MTAQSLIGARLRRREDPRLLTGTGQFAADLRFNGLLHAAFLRSPYPHAQINKMSLEGARGSPGVLLALSAEDAAVLATPMPAGMPAPDLYLRTPSPLATKRVHFQGQAVAMLVTAEAYQAADALERIEIEYDPLAAVAHPDDARRAGATLVHEDIPGNHVGAVHIAKGDAGAAFEQASVTVRRTLSVERSTCAAMETRGAVAQPVGPDGGPGITLHTSTQAPHNHRSALARILELPVEQVRVVAPDVGGGFGPKGRLYPEEVAICVAALRLGRPVSWQADRTDDFLTTYQGRGTVVDAEIAADADGRILGLRAHLVQDCGAYVAMGLMVPGNSAMHMMGPYRIPALAFDVDGFYTNKAPLSPLRGGGREVGVYVIERMMDHLAAELGLDPLVVRERNLIQPWEFPYDTGFPSRGGSTVIYDSGDFPKHLAVAREHIGYDTFANNTGALPGHRKGVGVTLFIESTGFGGETARASLQADGAVLLSVGSPSNGQGHATTMAQMCAARLGVGVESIRYTSGDTAVVTEGVGTFGSRIAVTAGNASAEAGAALRRLILEAAEEQMEVSAHDLELVDGTIRVKGYPSRNLTLSELVGKASPETVFEVTTPFDSHGGAFAGGAHAAVVDVDIETGKIRVDKYLVVHDCGTVINPAIVEGQVHGGVIHGIGNALSEQMVYGEDAQLLTGSFASYQLAEIDAAPMIMDIIHHETPSPNNPEGIKGAGEGGTIGALATIARAVENALEEFGVEVNTLPIEPAWLVRSLTSAPVATGQNDSGSRPPT